MHITDTVLDQACHAFWTTVRAAYPADHAIPFPLAASATFRTAAHDAISRWRRECPCHLEPLHRVRVTARGYLHNSVGIVRTVRDDLRIDVEITRYGRPETSPIDPRLDTWTVMHWQLDRLPDDPPAALPRAG